MLSIPLNGFLNKAVERHTIHPHKFTFNSIEWIQGRVELKDVKWRYLSIPLNGFARYDIGEGVERHARLSIPLNGFSNVATHADPFQYAFQFH